MARKPVFISYRHKAKDRVEAFLQQMRERGIPYWYDEYIPGSTYWRDVIADHIRDCSVFVLFLSRDMEEDRKKFIDKEVATADDEEKPIFIIQLDEEVELASGLKMDISLTQRKEVWKTGIDACLDDLEKQLDSAGDPSAPGAGGLPDRGFSLLERCRERFEHLASQLGVHDLDAGIDENLFCPIYEEGKESKGEPVDLYSVIRENDHTHILLQADGGLGKTYTFLHVMHLLLRDGHPCAYIPCYLFTGSDGEEDNLIVKNLCNLYLPSGTSDEAAMNRYFRAQKDKVFHLFLDGYNEAVAKPQLARELARISSSLPDVKIIISSRYSDAVFASNKYGHYTMRGLNADKVKAILKEHGRNYSRLNIGLRKLLLTPMFLSLFIRMKEVDAHIDTAAELMDRERKRVIEAVSRGGLESVAAEAKECLEKTWPGFVREEYLSTGHELSFSGARLREYLEAHAGPGEKAENAFKFLEDFSLIRKYNEFRNSYAYQHEHFRDYYVAYAVIRGLREGLDLRDASARAEAVMAALDGNYSEIVLRYIGELAQCGMKDNVLQDALRALRRDAVADEAAWLGARLAGVTARIIRIFMLTLDNSLVGMDLEGLNLSAVQLNRARTCTRKDKASFTGSLIAENTFIGSLHESAPRRVELLCLDSRSFLVTVSNQDLLISALPEMDKVWRYPHQDAEGKPVSTNPIVSSTMLGGCLLTVDDAGAVREWDFSMKDGIPCASAVRNHPDAEPAVKVFPWSDPDGPLIALQKKEGVILEYYDDEDPETGIRSLALTENEYRLPGLEGEKPNLTMTSVPSHLFFCWAGKREDGVHVFRFDADEGACRELCVIPEPGLQPDRMLCVGSEQATRENNKLDFGKSPQDGNWLILSAVCGEYTRVYQIPLSRSGAGEGWVTLSWPDGRQELVNSPGTERDCNRVNAMSFADGKMVLAAGDGRVYPFRFDEILKRFVPDTGANVAVIAGQTFAVEDVLFVSDEALAAVCINRSVHLLDAATMFPKKILPGYNDGLRQLLLLREGLAVATAYDGGLLELGRGDGRWTCRDKLPVMADSSRSSWCWSVEKIDAGLYAAGGMNEIVLADLTRDRVLCRITATGKNKIEHLLYLPNLDSTLIASSVEGARLYRVAEKNGEMFLEERGALAMPDTPSCYWIVRCGDRLYASVNVKVNKERTPRIMGYSLTEPLAGQEPEIIETGAPFGRIRDIRALGPWLMASGLCGGDGGKECSYVGFYNLRDGTWSDLKLQGFRGYIIHSAAWQEAPDTWRVAVAEKYSNGRLRRYRLDASGGELKAEELGEPVVFPASPCDVAFDGAGDLLVTALDGGLYALPWTEEEYRRLFRNKCYLQTFGADMSALYSPVDPSGRLGTVLADFGNRLEKTARAGRRGR